MKREAEYSCIQVIMGKDKYHRLPDKDPVNGGPLYISEITGEESGVTIRGKFDIPVYARLTEEQQRFLETFLRCRGMFNSVERELGISYPTVKARLESLLESLGLSPVKEDAKKDKIEKVKRKILDQLESGEITPEEAKRKIGVTK
jgi:hypothetical protein